MPVYIVESANQTFSGPDDLETRVAWFAGMPKRVNARRGLEIARALKYSIDNFNSHAASPVAIVSDKEDAWFSKLFAVEATPEAAAELAQTPGLIVRPHDGKHIPHSMDGWR